MNTLEAYVVGPPLVGIWLPETVATPRDTIELSKTWKIVETALRQAKIERTRYCEISVGLTLQTWMDLSEKLISTVPA